MALADEFPLFGLRITAGPLELGPITDDVIPALVELARDGIHDPDAMPFYFPWSTAPSEEIGANMAQFYWQSRAQLSPARWSLNLAVRLDGEVVGCQDLAAVDFPVTRTAETGSWLGLRHQGRGIGTRMRQAICGFAFDHLGAAEVTSGAFLDNPSSLAVSRKVGYRTNGTERRTRREGEMAELQRLVLAPDDLVRGDDPVEVTGVEAFRAFIGIDDD